VCDIGRARQEILDGCATTTDVRHFWWEIEVTMRRDRESEITECMLFVCSYESFRSAGEGILVC
jgi:hypothetical protein